MGDTLLYGTLCRLRESCCLLLRILGVILLWRLAACRVSHARSCQHAGLRDEDQYAEGTVRQLHTSISVSHCALPAMLASPALVRGYVRSRSTPLHSQRKTKGMWVNVSCICTDPFDLSEHQRPSSPNADHGPATGGARRPRITQYRGQPVILPTRMAATRAKAPFRQFRAVAPTQFLIANYALC
jgi:hypothetical protein